MGPVIRPARTPDKSQIVVLRNAQLAPQPVVVGSARTNPAPSVLVVSAPAELPSTESAAPAPAAPQVDHAAQIEAARKQAFEEGYAEGFAGGADKMKRALAQRQSELDKLTASIEKSCDAALSGIEDIAMGVAWEALCKILGETAATPGGVRAFVQQGANQVRTEEKVLIRLCPSDLEMLREGDGSPEPRNETRILEFIADPSIELGGCIVETGAGRIDARLETQLARLRDTLLATRRSRPSAEPQS